MPGETGGDFDLETLDARGFAVARRLVTPQQCADLSALYDDPARFRSRIVMGRYGFGRGEYQYFSYPLPDLIQSLRETLYRRLVPLANAWRERLGLADRFPSNHAAFQAECHAVGQSRPTPLLLRYGPGDYNRLHQDLYGDLYFPIQVAVLLSSPQEDFDGGEFVLTEQKPRSQSRADVVALGLGDAVAFSVNDRPAKGSRGYFRVKMRHGVSEIRRGHRMTLGIIFHDAH